MIYVDTNVLIAHINPKDPLHEKALELISKYEKHRLVASQITTLELYSVFSRTMNLSDVELEALVKYTIRKCNVDVINVDWRELTVSR